MSEWLNGKTVILTGAKRMGWEISRRLGALGAQVAIAYRSSFEKARPVGFAVKADVSNAGEVAELVKRVKSRFGRIDALVHMAAPYERIPWDQLNEAAWSRSMDAIGKGSFLMLKAVGDELLGNAADELGIKGKMVFVSDWAVERPYCEYLPYLAAKGAVEALVRCAANELAPHVLVNAIRPGPMLKPFDLPKEEEAAALKHTPLGRWGGIEPLSEEICFLLDRQHFATGSIRIIDGGRTVSYP